MVSKSSRFEFQKWAVYEKSLEITKAAHEVCSILPKESATSLRDQLRRASQSIALNIAEGSARYTSRDKANFFRIARGSVFECVAVLDLIQRLELTGKNMGSLFEEFEVISRMLSGLINYVEGETYKKKGKKKEKSAARI